MKEKSKRVWVFVVLGIFLLGSYGTYILFMLPGAGKVTNTTVTTKADLKDKILIFHSKDCPHCKALIEDFKTKKIEDTVKNILWLEVDADAKDKYNVELYVTKVQECGLGEESYVVPFGYANGKCYVGGDKISELVYPLASITTTTTTLKITIPTTKK